MPAVLSRLQIHDMSNNPLAIIPLGKAKAKTGYIRGMHPINLNYIEEVIVEMQSDVARNMNNSPLYELIKLKIKKLYETLQKLTPPKQLKQPKNQKRTKRWDAIGAGWKYIAGSPDANDLRLINKTTNALIIQNNKQIMINQQIVERIQEVTTITYKVLTTYKDWKDNHLREIQFLVTISNIDSLVAQVETIEEAIILAKHEIPSSKLLSITSFNHMYDFLKKQNHR